MKPREQDHDPGPLDGGAAWRHGDSAGGHGDPELGDGRAARGHGDSAGGHGDSLRDQLERLHRAGGELRRVVALELRRTWPALLLVWALVVCGALCWWYHG